MTFGSRTFLALQSLCVLHFKYDFFGGGSIQLIRLFTQLCLERNMDYSEKFPSTLTKFMFFFVTQY